MRDILIRQLAAEDASALASFYHGLSKESLRTFRPLGPATTADACIALARDNAAATKHDLVAIEGDEIVGWGFLWDLDKPEPMFGLAIADRCQGQGLGARLAGRVLAEAGRRGIPRIVLTVVKDNEPARRIYTRLGFTIYGEFRHDEDGLDYYRMERVTAPDGGRPHPQ
jgi:ribosomal protein S18 acetylase RimI-like enzyme